MRARTVLIILALLAICWPTAARAQSSPTNSSGYSSDWLLVNTDHFTVLTNTDPERAKLIAYKLEQYRYIFSQFAPELVAATPAPTRVQVFRDGSSVNAALARLGNINNVVAGYFQPGKDLIAINDLFNISDNVSFHEYTHLLTRLDGNYPLWFVEGIAEFYETFEIVGNKARIGEITTSRLHIMRMTKFIPLRKMLAFASYHQVMEETSLDTFYAQSWLLTHYLMTDDRRRAQLTEYVKLLRSAESPDAAFRTAFQCDYDDLEAGLKRYLAEGKYQVYTLSFDSEKIESDVDIISVEETEKSKAILAKFGSEPEDGKFNLVLSRQPAKEPAVIINFSAFTERLGIKTAPSTRPVVLESADPSMHARSKEALEQFNAGNQANEGGDQESALASYERAIKLDPDLAPAYTQIGNIYALRKDYEMARLAYEKARAVAPSYAGTYLNVAVMQYEQGKANEAEASFRTALSLYPSSAAAHLGLANIYLQRRDYNRARTEYTRTLNLVRGKGPEALNAHIGLGAVYFYLGEHEKAKEQYQRCIKLDPGNGAWHRAYADNCRLLRQFDEATSAYLRAIELNANDAKALESLEWIRKIIEYQRLVKQRSTTMMRSMR